jgi:drug/metabolite transporter (DMT)-like permease
MDYTQESIPGYKLKALAGIVISIIAIFVGVYYKDVSILGLITPVGILFGMFFAGYHIKGKTKDGIKWAGIFLGFLIVVVSLSYFKK